MNNPSRKETLIVLGIIVVLTLICFYDVTLLGKTFKVTTSNSQSMPYGPYGQKENKTKYIPVNGTDASVLEEPVYEFVKQNLKKGILPLWNPHQGCGYPFIGVIQIGMFFPLNYILYTFPQPIAWDILILSRFLLAAMLTYWLMRSLGFKPIPSLSSGIIFMLSGPMVLYQYWTVNVDLMLPILLIAIDRIIRKTRPRNIAYLALTVGLTFFAGHPEHIFLVNLFGALFFVYRFFSLRRTINIKKVLFYAAAAYLLGICFSSMALFPFLRNLATEFWKGHPEGLGLMHEEFRERMITLVLPHFFQKESLTFQFTFAGWWGGYIGALPFVLAFTSLFNNHKRGLNYFLAIVGFLTISKAYGFAFINWIGYLPLLNMCRFTPHILHIFALTMAMLAGMGVRTILGNKNSFWRALIFSAIILILAGIHLFIYRKSLHFSISLQASLFVLGVLFCFQTILFLKDKKLLKKKLATLLLLFVITAELFCYIHRERPNRLDSFGKVPYIEWLKKMPERARSYGIFWVFYPNTATAYGVDDLGIFFGLIPKRFVKFYNTLIEERFKNDLRPPALRAAPITMGKTFLDMLNLKYIITPSDEVMSRLIIGYDESREKRTVPVYSNEVNIYERKDVLPRSFIVHKVLFEPDEKRAFEILRQIQLNFKDIVLLNHQKNPLIQKILRLTPMSDNSTSKITKYTPNEVIVRAVMESPGFLVLSDAYHPDWKAYVNGKPSTIYLANSLIRAVFLPPGVHTVRFVFEPASFYWGAFITVIALIIILLLAAEERIRKALRKK